ncbi:TRAP transporter large permease [Brucella anthropi]|uniref:TRAP transporter large permease n=1 Tax=Brucella anthropi TaxID=529 RepID=A0A6I0DKE9_BRUAN|nr:TRAP transporter large permease [Brucella anthropi]KAB2790313.1 TRAP transporter large permease [Brucella anthropi]
MLPSVITSLAIGGSLLLIALRVPIAYALLIGAFSGLCMIYGLTPGEGFSWFAAEAPVLAILADVPYRFVHNYEISTIPLYLLLGALAKSSGITTDIFASMRVLIGRLPGGLAISTIFGCGGFSALSGSSVACASVMGRITVPEMIDNGYDRRLAAGTVAVGGTLGSLIPPSVAFLIFAVLAEQSVSRLLLAGLIPGLLTMAGYVLTILVWVKLRPSVAPVVATRSSGRDIFLAIFNLWPATVILGIIVGGILTGAFTIIQSAAISVLIVLLIGIAKGRIGLSETVTALREAVIQSAVIFAMAFGAKLLISLVAVSHLPQDLLALATESGLGPRTMMAVIILALLVMGMFLDPAGILLLMVPVTLPIIDALGFSPIWYAVIFVKLLEIGLVTPPVGLCAYVVQAAVPGSYAVTLRHVFAGIFPFFVLEVVVVALLLALPQLSLFLPSLI